MTKQKVQVLKRSNFPSNDFFKHLLNGTHYYQSHNFERAVEEWSAAQRMNYSEPIPLNRINDQISCGCLLDEIPLLFFLYAVYINKVTGTSVIKTEGSAKKLLFHEGNLVRAGTSKREERIGKYLLKRGNFTPEKLDHLFSEAKKQGKKIGQYLVESSLLTTKALQEVLSLQAEEILSDIFFWEKGQILILEKPIPRDAVVNYTPLEIATIAAQRGFNFTDFRNRIPNNKTIFRHSPYANVNQEEIRNSLNANHLFIFLLIDGARNIDQLIKFSGADEVSVINILYRLNSAGLIRKTKEVAEYEDKEYMEMSKILGVLFEVYQLLINELFHELGKRGKKVIQISIKVLKPDHQKIFSDIEMDEPDKMEINSIFRNISQNFPSPDQRLIFIDAFLELYLLVFAEYNKFVGRGLANVAAEKIGRSISDIERFATNSSYKNRLLEVLHTISKTH